MKSRWITGIVVFALLGAVAPGTPARAVAQVGDLQYFGGPVMGDPTVYTIFWLPPGQHFERDATRDTAYEGLINGFIKDLDGSPYFKVAAQYSQDANGNAIKGGPITGRVTLGGTWVDTTTYPHGAIQSVFLPEIREEITRAMAVNGWTPGLDKIYFVYLAANTNMCSQDSGPCTAKVLAGDHYAFTGGDTPLLGVAMADGYSFFPFPFFAEYGLQRVTDASTPNGDAAADVEVYATAHLLLEAVTDPMVGLDGVSPVNPAWNQGDVNHTEMADVCERYGTAMTVGAHAYILPALYSNAGHACVFSDPALPVQLKLASKSVRKGKKQTLTITTGPDASLVIDIIAPLIRVVRAKAGLTGKYVYRWAPKTSTEIVVTAATADGRAGFSLASFKMRRRA